MFKDAHWTRKERVVCSLAFTLGDKMLLAPFAKQGCGAALDHYIVYSSDAIIGKNESCCFPTLHNTFVNGFVRVGKNSLGSNRSAIF
jgi:hypothetical protein